MEKNKYPVRPILIVDDEVHSLNSVVFSLDLAGFHNTITCSDSREVISILSENEVQLVLLDLIMPHISGQEVLAQLVQKFPDVPVIVVTGVNELETAVECMRNGAFDYLLKPLVNDHFIPSVRRAIEVSSLRQEAAMLSERFLAETLNQPEIFSQIITQNKQMISIFRYCEAISKSNHPVLITGETGVGKELIAEALHNLSGHQGELVAVNVAGLDDNMFSDSLFGHLKGSFTGADRDRKGLIDKASGGTLFLDEIGDLSAASQVKLLRLLDKREYYPVGSDTPRYADARLLVATHTDIESLQSGGRFRRDLFYRLKTHHIPIPPLRDRVDDIPLLLDCFLESSANELGKKKPTYHKDLISLLKSYSFPGNVRELKALVHDAVSQHNKKMLSSEAFRAHIHSVRTRDSTTERLPSERLSDWISRLDQLPSLQEIPDIFVAEAMRRANNNQSVAASILGISRQAISQRIKKNKQG